MLILVYIYEKKICFWWDISPASKNLKADSALDEQICSYGNEFDMEISHSFSKKELVKIEVFLKISVKNCVKIALKESNFGKLTDWFHLMFYSDNNDFKGCNHYIWKNMKK